MDRMLIQSLHPQTAVAISCFVFTLAHTSKQTNYVSKKPLMQTLLFNKYQFALEDAQVEHKSSCNMKANKPLAIGFIYEYSYKNDRKHDRTKWFGQIFPLQASVMLVYYIVAVIKIHYWSTLLALLLCFAHANLTI